jgi:hypothetical protein
MGPVASQIFLQRAHFGPLFVYSIVLHPTTSPTWQMFQILLVFFDYMHIRKVSGCSNRGPMSFFDGLAAYFLLVLLGMEI